MRVEYVYKLKPLSEQLIEVSDDIEPQELIILMRDLAKKLCIPASLYLDYRHQNYFIVRDQEKLTKDDFMRIINKANPQEIFNVIDAHNTMSQLRLIEELGINSTSRKPDILNKICQDEQLMYEYFKDILVDYFTISTSRLKDTAQIEINGHSLVYSESEVYDILPDTKQIEFWKLDIYAHYHYDSKPKLKLDIKDDDSLLIEKIKGFVNGSSDVIYSLHADNVQLVSQDLRRDSLRYKVDMYHLQQDFGVRKGSKKDTFIEGLKQKENLAAVREMMGKQIMISIKYQPALGQPLDKETFEGIALHLRLIHMNCKQLICTVIKEESDEVIHAIWNDEKIEIYPVLLELAEH
jgi:hypothetical protein